MTDQTAEQLVASYLQSKAHCDAESKRFTDYLRPYREQMEAVKNKLHEIFLAQGLQNLKTDEGTAFLSTTTTPKIVDRDAYLDWVNEHWEDGGNAMLQLGAPQVTAVREYLDAHEGQLPPGVTISQDTHMNVRKA